jgi:hypothetical protein
MVASSGEKAGIVIDRALPRWRPRLLSGTIAGVLTQATLVASDLAALASALVVAVAVRIAILPAVSQAFARPTFSLTHYLQFWWLPLVYLSALWYAGLYAAGPSWYGGVSAARRLRRFSSLPCCRSRRGRRLAPGGRDGLGRPAGGCPCRGC